MFVEGPIFTRFDLNVKKRFPFAGTRSFDIGVDVLNLFNAINFTAVAQTGSGADDQPGDRRLSGSERDVRSGRPADAAGVPGQLLEGHQRGDHADVRHVSRVVVSAAAARRARGPLPTVAGAEQRGRRPLLRDYIAFTVTAPPPALELDPFYKKYVDAHGIPVVTSDKVPDAALLMARDIVQFMLANRPDLRKELIRKKWKLAIMAQTEVTYDIPEHRKYRLLPKIDDERLTPEQRENYHKPGGVGTHDRRAVLERARPRLRRRAGRREHDVVRGGEPARLSGHALLRQLDLRARVLARHHARRDLHRRSRNIARRSRTRTRPRRSRASRRRRAIPATTSTSTGRPASRPTSSAADAGPRRCSRRTRASTSSCAR